MFVGGWLLSNVKGAHLDAGCQNGAGWQQFVAVAGASPVAGWGGHTPGDHFLERCVGPCWVQQKH